MQSQGTTPGFWPPTNDNHAGLESRDALSATEEQKQRIRLFKVRTSARLASSRLLCCGPTQADPSSLSCLSLFSNLSRLTSSPPQLSPPPAFPSSYAPHSGGWLPTSPHRAVSLLRDSPSVFIDLPAAAVRWQQQNWGAAVHKLLLLLRQRHSARSGATYKRRHKKMFTKVYSFFVLANDMNISEVQYTAVSAYRICKPLMRFAFWHPLKFPLTLFMPGSFWCFCSKSM